MWFLLFVCEGNNHGKADASASGGEGEVGEEIAREAQEEQAARRPVGGGRDGGVQCGGGVFGGG